MRDARYARRRKPWRSALAPRLGEREARGAAQLRGLADPAQPAGRVSLAVGTRTSPRLRAPRTNGKAERFIPTLRRPWAERFVRRNSRTRGAELAYWLPRDNFHRPHAAVAGLPPITRPSFGDAENTAVASRS